MTKDGRKYEGRHKYRNPTQTHTQKVEYYTVISTETGHLIFAGAADADDQWAASCQWVASPLYRYVE
jgi:hypothetical protein